MEFATVALGESKTSRTIFIGGIPMMITAKQIVAYLSRFDDVEKIQVPKETATGVLKGYAKAVLATTEGVRRITDQSSHELGGLNVGIFKWQNKSTYLSKRDRLSERKIYVRYPPHFSINLIKDHFLKYGGVEEVIIKRDPCTKEIRNFCYVVFKSSDQACLAVKDSPHRVGSAKLICSMSIFPKANEKEDVLAFHDLPKRHYPIKDSGLSLEQAMASENQLIRSEYEQNSSFASADLQYTQYQRNAMQRNFRDCTNKSSSNLTKVDPRDLVRELHPTQITKANDKDVNTFQMDVLSIINDDEAQIPFEWVFKPTEKKYFKERPDKRAYSNHLVDTNIQFRLTSFYGRVRFNRG